MNTLPGQCPKPQGAAGGLECCQVCLVGEEIEITFSYWDGSGHRRTVKVVCEAWAPFPLLWAQPSSGKEMSVPDKAHRPLWHEWPGGSREGGGECLGARLEGPFWSSSFPNSLGFLHACS